jgi:hypothetical protein
MMKSGGIASALFFVNVNTKILIFRLYLQGVIYQHPECGDLHNRVTRVKRGRVATGSISLPYLAVGIISTTRAIRCFKLRLLSMLLYTLTIGSKQILV